MRPASLLAVAADTTSGADFDEQKAVVAAAAGLVLILLLLLIALVMVTLLWRRTGKRGNGLERDLSALRAKVDSLEDLWAEAGTRYGTGASTSKRPRGGDGPPPGGRSLDAGGDDDGPPPPGF
ncbi:hypothetical protein [Phycisphaera mikurensis]|uniref:Uncharacterized protein n=1 Tax=Phycisphaera mikurensis (strain NBRC 102666 / KCTC 22515 / FYK2301M01) TaxID=1142394 RepID=I0IIJ6_PHYMF|nr:hypothetical protein [Phycisphaera mikurensis]MBB6442759.1 hypothetical protein [Phycisphaera mikurensis]BAM05084.1 hypothetical protein PSMK_29250 [Phycisphaera mikurensis NBRC 102666]